ncbi:MAG: YihY/virulence factor BrkB family protein [Lachnospiraceae bacterium]|nr:YihY/virulence factor BrkB family protein [Lachnospiraceae bacterium]
MMRLFSVGMKMKKEIEKQHVGAYAAQSAYFIILSFLPLIILLLSLFQYTGIGKGQFYALIQSVIPVNFQSWLIGIVDEMYEHTIAAVSISALMTIWSAGKSFMALNRGMNAICRVDKKPNYFLMRIRGAVFALFFVILLTATLVLIVFGNLIHEMMTVYFPVIAFFTRIILSFRAVLMLVLFILFFALLYRYLPNRKTTLLEQLPGAIFAAVAWYLFSFGFSMYIEYGNAFRMYGSLTTAILLMFWLYFVMYIVLIGMEINYQIQYFLPISRSAEE